MSKSLIMRKILDRNRIELIAAYPDGEALLEKLKQGGWYKVTVKESRNPEFHKLAFAFLGNVFEYQHDYTDREMLRTRLSIDAGHIETWEFKSGKVAIKVKSWAFDEMDELTFQPLIAKIVEAAIVRFEIPRDIEWLPDIFVEDHF